MKTRSFLLFQPLSLDSWYNFNILGPFYFTVFIDYSCWSVTLWWSSLPYKPNEAMVLCASRWYFRILYVVPSSVQYVSKYQLNSLLPHSSLAFGAWTFLCSWLCKFLIASCRMYWKLFHERVFLGLLLLCLFVAWFSQLRKIPCFSVMIIFCHIYCSLSWCWVWGRWWNDPPLDSIPSSGSFRERSEWDVPSQWDLAFPFHYDFIFFRWRLLLLSWWLRFISLFSY